MDLGSIVGSILWTIVGIEYAVIAVLIAIYVLFRLFSHPKRRHIVRTVRLAPGTELYGAIKIEGSAVRLEGVGAKIEGFATKLE